jgi:hypothetical protein
MKNQLIIPASGTGLSSAWRPLWLAAALALPTLAGAQTFALTNLWRLATNVVSSSNNLVNGDNNRGMACLASSNLVFVSNKGNTTISAIDGTTGARVGFVNMTGVAGSGTWQINQLAVADDGILYGAGLTTALSAASGYKLYRWADWSQPPTLAFASTNSALTNYIAGKRVGDTIAITGAGSDTRILVQVENSTTPTGTNLLLSTTDGTNFTPTVLYSLLPTLSNGGAGPQFGYQFYTNNTFLFKPAGAALYLIQFPPNFASLASPVQAPVLLTNTVSGVLAGNSVLLAYHQTAGHLGVYGPMVNAAPATVPVNLYNILALSGLSASLAATNTSHTAATGNFAGAVALGGAGRTNVIYTLDCNSCLTASAILRVAPQPPLITTAPVGGTLYPPMTLSVGISPSSSKPLYYQWQASTNGTATATTFTNIPGALTNSYALGTSLTNYFRVVVTNSIGAVTSAPVLVTLLSAVTNPVVSQLWRVAAGQAGYAYLNPSDNNSRGIAYDTNSQRVVVASVSGGPGLYLLDGNTGTNLGTLNLTGALLTGFSGVALDQVGIADDGAVFAGNLASGGSAFNLTYWPAPTTNAAAYQAYSGDPGGTGSDRWGDSLAVRGAGSTTEILLGSRTGTNVALLTTGDGSNFVANLLAITNAPAGFAANGIAFGAGNTLWAKANLGNLWAVAYDPMTLSGGVVFDYAQPSQAPTYMVGVGLDPAHSILAGIVLSDTPHDLRLYQLTGTSDAPILFQQSFFAAANANGNANAAIAMKYPRVYGLDVNNGIVALTYGVPASSPPAIVTPPASRTVYTNDPAATLSVQVSGSLPLYYQWRFNATNIPGATAQSYTLTNPPLHWRDIGVPPYIRGRLTLCK